MVTGMLSDTPCRDLGSRYTPTVIVSYETAVDEGALDTLASAVSRYAVALYDHEDISVLNSIKASCV